MTSPDADHELTYEQATPEQIAEARAWARRQLDELDERTSRPGYWDEIQDRVGIRVEPDQRAA